MSTTFSSSLIALSLLLCLFSSPLPFVLCACVRVCAHNLSNFLLNSYCLESGFATITGAPATLAHFFLGNFPFFAAPLVPKAKRRKNKVQIWEEIGKVQGSESSRWE